MPILVSGAGTQLNRSTGVTLSGLQQCIPKPSQTCNRRVYPAVPASTLFLVNNANTTVEDQGGDLWLVSKTAGTPATFDADTVGTQGFTGDFSFGVRRVNTTNSFFIAANTDPLTDSNYPSLDYSWFFASSISAGSDTWGIWENGVNLGGALSDSGATLLAWIWRTGTTLGYGVAADLATAQASPLRTVAGVTATLYFDSSIYELATSFSVQMAGAASMALSLTAAAGTFNYSGQTAAVALAMPAALGTFSYSGQPSLLERGYAMPAVLGTFTYSGQAALLERGYALAAASATFTYSGQAAALIATYGLPAAAGTFVYSGQPALLERGYAMPAGLGSFSYSGQAAAFPSGLAMPADAGMFAYTGEDAAFAAHLTMPGANGVFSYAGQAAMATLSLASFPPAGSAAGVRVTTAFLRP